MNLIKEVIACFRKMLTLISPELNTKVCYLVKFRKMPDLKSPVTFNEKILKMKLDTFPGNENIKRCADKYRVREYIEECGCSEIEIPLLAVYDSAEQIEWDKLPDKFAVKWNFGCGYNIICTDKAKLNIPETVSRLKKWGKTDAYLPYSEIQYKNVAKKIIVEKYISDEFGGLPRDYKVFCFNGKAKYVMLCVDREKGRPVFLYLDRDWNLMAVENSDPKFYNHNKENVSASVSVKRGDVVIPKPEGIDELFEYAEKLSSPFPFVRADFYLVDGKTFFGELTFTPCGGLDFGMPKEIDALLSDSFDVSWL